MLASAFVATSILCATQAVNRPEIDAGPIIQECLNSSVQTVELLPGRYFVSGTIQIENRHHLTIRTQGVDSGPACLAAKASPCAILVAAKNNRGEAIFKSKSTENLSLRYLALDGNNAARRASLGDTNWPGGTGYNAKIHDCQRCRFVGFASVRAAQGTGLEFEGDDAIFERVLFKDNGWDASSSPEFKLMRWADGLTVWHSKNLRIVNSTFVNNTDIDLIIGGAPNAVIEDNLIGNSHSFAFGALMLDNFNGFKSGDFTGAVIRRNRIDCGEGMCGIGINLGPHLWYPSKAIQGGKISDNVVTGARQGILGNGAVGVSLERNQVLPSQYYQHQNCMASPMAFSPDDQIEFVGNSVSPEASRLVGCNPFDLARLTLVQSGVDPRVSNFYRELLGRNPDLQGGQAWTKSLEKGARLDDIRRSIAYSAECDVRLTELSRQLLRRELDPGGRKSWREFLLNGGNLAQLRVAILMSPEGLARSSESEQKGARK